jgi:hypothetical protein
MWYSTTDGQYIYAGNQFTLDGVEYPSNWLNLSTQEEKEIIGLEEVIATNSPANDQYYWVSTELDEATLTYVNTPKELAGVKTTAVSQINATAYSILLPSDWMVVKAVETSTTVPTDWNTWRAEIRTQAQDAITAIEAATDVDEVATAVQVQWANDPNTPSIVVDTEKPSV